MGAQDKSKSASPSRGWHRRPGPKLSRALDRNYLTRQRPCDLAPQRSNDLTRQRLDHLAGQRSNNLPRQRWDDLRQPRSTNAVGCCMGGGEDEAEENGRENRLVHILRTAKPSPSAPRENAGHVVKRVLSRRDVEWEVLENEAWEWLARRARCAPMPACSASCPSSSPWR